MVRYLKYITFFLLGFFISKFLYDKNKKDYQKQEVAIVLNSISNLSKLVVSKGTFSEVYNYSDSKKYFYDYLSFDKKAIVTVNAEVEVGYDLTKMELQIDSLHKKIIINKLPKEEIVISHDIKYFDLQQSKFNSFSKEDLNKINHKSIDKINSLVEITQLKKEAKSRFFEEISKIYQLSAVYGWEIVNNTENLYLDNFTE